MARTMIGRVLSHYEVLSQLGAGGMGEVYLAEDRRLGRKVALKVLPAELAKDAERLKRLEREARTLGSLDHPNIVTLYSVEEAEGIHFLTMAYVEGESLDRQIPEGGLPATRLVELGTALAEALAAAHAQGVVHRDLKPGNVMVDRSGRVRVLDFGLAKAIADPRSAELGELATMTATADGLMVGTVPYMSPEQAEGRPVDARSDLFSLGTMLYELATGRRPFAGESAMAMASAILKDAPEDLRGQRPDLPERLVELIERCLEKDRERRIQTAREVVDALAGVKRELDSMAYAATTVAPPVAAPRRIQVRWGLSAAVATVLLIAALVGFDVGGLRQKLAGIGEEAPIRSLAVLPLRNLSGDDEQEYFVDGTTEALIHSLAQIRTLKVISRTSVMRYKQTELSLPQIARELGVEAVVEGSVQREGDTVRVTAQLVDGATDQPIWGGAIERPLTGALQLQSAVARAIADAIAVELSPDEQSRLSGAREVNPRTYEAYLRGKHFLDKGTPESLEKGMAFLREAVDLDPADPLAYAGLASGYVTLGHATGEPEYIERAKAAARRALELDESQAEAQAVLAMVALYIDWDWQAADFAFRRALEANPSNAEVYVHYGFFHLLRGDLERASAAVERCHELDPLSASSSLWLAELYWPSGLYDRAEHAALRALELSPGRPHAHAWLAQTYLGQGRVDEALEHARIAAEGEPRWVPWLGVTLLAAGREEEARAVLDRLLADPRAGHTLLELAFFRYTLGEQDEAMALLERGYETREVFMPWIASWVDFGELTEDPRFQELLTKMNLEPVRPRLLATAARLREAE